MEQHWASLSPVFGEQLGHPTTPDLVVHVEIRFTDPVIRSRYSRSYGSSPTFRATNMICRGLVRRIERCCEEFITRKDSGALEMFKGDTYERKPQRARFIEATQMFEFVPGYTIELCFRSKNLQRRVPIYERRININSTQSAPLTLFLSEDMISKALHFINQGLDSRKREFDDHFQDQRAFDLPTVEDDTLKIGLKVFNNLGPAYDHVQRSLRSKLVLFRDQNAIDCDLFLCDVEKHLAHLRSEADSTMDAMNDFEFRIVELKGFGWTLREPAKFTLGPSASHGRRTIQAALDRIQTGIGDVIRGHNLAIHIKAYKRGHVVLDKAIVAHEKHGKPRETFASRDDAQLVFVTRLKARIQKDMDRMFEDSCCIDDIPEDDEDCFARPVTPAQPEQPVFEGLSPRYSPSSIRSSPARQSRPALSPAQSSPRPRVQRVFSLSRCSTDSMVSIDYLKPGCEPLTRDNSRPIIAPSEQVRKPQAGESPLLRPRGELLAPAEVKPAQSFSFVSGEFSSAIRINNGLSIVEEQALASDGANVDSLDHKLAGDVQRLGETRPPNGMTSNEGRVDPLTTQSGSLPGEALPGRSSTSSPAVQDEASSRDHDTVDAPLNFSGAATSKMDTPMTFEDAREYVTSPVPEDKANSGTPFTLARAETPREDDEFSTAPSTPELSTGASSLRHSIIETPVLPRFDSGTSETVLRGFYPDSETERPAVHLQGESIAEPVSKEDWDAAAVPEPQVDQHDRSRLLPSLAEQSTAAEGPEGVHGDGTGRHNARTPHPEGWSVTLDQTPDANPTPAPRPSTASDASTDSGIKAKTESGRQTYNTAHLGAEPALGPGIPFHAPDFPTSEVRTSHAPEEVGHSESASKLGSPLEPEPDAMEAAGDELGAGRGAETKLGEDKDRRDAHDDVADALPGGGPRGNCGAQLGAVPLGAEVVAEMAGLGTEDPVGAAHEDEGRILGDDVRSDGGEMGCHVGDDGNDDGFGVVSDGDEEDRCADEGVDVGPARGADVVGSGGGTHVPVPDASEDGLGEHHGVGSGIGAQIELVDIVHCASTQPSKTRFENTDGSGSGTEAACLGTNDQLSDKLADAADEADRHVPGSGTSSNLLESTPAIPEQQVDSQGPELTPIGAEQGYALQVQKTALADGPESHGNTAKGDDAERVHQDVISEAQATGPGGEDELMPGHDEAEEELCESKARLEHPDDNSDDRPVIQPVVSEAPATVTEISVDEAESDKAQVMGKLDAVPALARDAEATNSESTFGGGVEEKHDLAPGPTETAKPGQPERDVGDGPKEEPGVVPPGNSVAKPTGSTVRGDDLGEEVLAEPISAPDPAPAHSVDSAETKTPKQQIHERDEGPTTELAAAAGMGLWGGGICEAENGLITVPYVIGAKPPRLAVGKGVQNGLDILSALAAVAESELSERGFGEETRVPVLTTVGPIGTQTSEVGTGKDIAGPASELDGTSKGVEPEVESVFDPDETKRQLSDALEIAVDNIVRASPAPEAESDGSSRGSTEVAEEEERTSGLQTSGQSSIQGSDDQPNGTGGQAALEPEPRATSPADAEAASDDGIPTRTSEPEGGTEEAETPDNETIAPAAETESATPMPMPLPTPQQKPEKTSLAPIPDLSKLFPAGPVPNSISSDVAASFASISRNSVDTIRPSTDNEQQRPGTADFCDLPHASSSSNRPQTAGYLCLGLCESRSVEIGLRGALGDVKVRRLSLPLQRTLNQGPAMGRLKIKKAARSCQGG
ncbi:hypothetical protein N657DRAFT_629790 [Parathielavia appendiculata]|uniref:Uncharacterized protein n=1 Tax=Parathielavia appendiculata TaxID=2587402 RepID=A0AAN6U941_9PEZI|nr:hypothetical protein N657DRAFT_629790 [Parathielavia appendiculata]